MPACIAWSQESHYVFFCSVAMLGEVMRAFAFLVSWHCTRVLTLSSCQIQSYCIVLLRWACCDCQLLMGLVSTSQDYGQGFPHAPAPWITQDKQCHHVELRGPSA